MGGFHSLMMRLMLGSLAMSMPMLSGLFLSRQGKGIGYYGLVWLLGAPRRAPAAFSMLSTPPPPSSQPTNQPTDSS